MTARRVHMLGGGLADLFAARLLALRRPHWHVCVHERRPSAATFGFAVGLTGGLLSSLRDAGPARHQALSRATHTFSTSGFRLPQGNITLARFHTGAISRTWLLRLLLNSGTRLPQEFGAEVSLGRVNFLVCGAIARLDVRVFTPVRTRDRVCLAHAYADGDTRSTFVIEASTETLGRTGLGDRRRAGNGESDDEALTYLSEAFEPLLGGSSLTGNRSRWGPFRTMRCARWHHGKVVLLGDAAATIHPSLATGTEIAMESAIAPADALTATEREPVAMTLERFEASRRPEVERLQERIVRSQLWWESFEARQHLAPALPALSYLTRDGAVSLDDLRPSDPELKSRAHRAFAGAQPDEVEAAGPGLTRWVPRQPADTARRRDPARLRDSTGADTATLEIHSGDAWGPEAEALVDRARTSVHRGAGNIRLTGADSRGALRDRLAFGERLREELPALVEVPPGIRYLRPAADGIVAGRTDLVHLPDAS
ncbi:FAD-dependent monooxygenase [Streptomyces canus]|uniref:FAD-dependent monooxygenase n=1 Tax=Streptomyces canus TaxID=58343 RepID=UPI0036EC920A